MVAAALLWPGIALAGEQVIWDVTNWRHPLRDQLAGAGFALQRVSQRAGGEWVITVTGPDIRRVWSQELAAAALRAAGGAGISVVQVCRGEEIATVVNSVDRGKRTAGFQVRSTSTRPLPLDAGIRGCWLKDDQILQTAMTAAKKDQRLAARLDRVRDQGGRVFVMIDDRPDSMGDASETSTRFFTIQLGAEQEGRTERVATLMVQPVTGDVLAEAEAGVSRDLATLRALDAVR